jgi:hypothetical protein
MRFIADRLARRGIASLIYDKRGSGESGGDWRTATYLDLAGDADAAIDLLATRRDIDASEIGVWGHSQGGMIAPAVAARGKNVAFVVDADGPIGPQYEQDLFRVRTALDESAFSPKERAGAYALYRQFVDVARTGTGYAELDAAIKQNRGKPWVDWLALPPRNSWIWKWYRSAGNFDATPYWREVTVPVLIVFGQRDRLVPPDGSISQTQAALRRNDHAAVEAIIYPGATHELHVEPGPGDAFFWWRMAPGYPDLVIDWIGRVSGRPLP